MQGTFLNMQVILWIYKCVKISSTLYVVAIIYGNQLKYLIVEVNTTINRYVTGYSKGIPIVERWESFVNSQVNHNYNLLQ